MENKSRLIIVSGLSGAGKGTIVKSLLEKYPQEYVLSISATSRAPRPGETDGREYFFKTREEFEKMIEEGELLEYAAYVDNYYGTPKAWVAQQLADNKNVILEIEINGAFQIKKIFPQATLVFVEAPDLDELRKRLEGRGTETKEQIDSRIERAKEELTYRARYDYVIVNRDVEKSVEMLHNITQLISKTGKTGEKNMLHPSYTDLMNVVNSDVAEGEVPIVQSRYSIVMAASKRARQIVDGDEPLVEAEGEKPLSVAVEEIYSGKVKILGDDD